MKNKIKKLVFIIGLFLICLTNVDAKEMTSEEIPNNSYVIGTHIFTEKTTLLTKHIMLSSKTIKSNSLDDMIVYYKTPRGKWINGADGTQLEAPTKFNIDYIDLELILTEYKIDYVLDGGIASNPLIYTALTDDFTLVNPIKEGYVFLGWTGSNGDTPELSVTIKKGTTGDLEYTANWRLYGDVNEDNEVDIADTITILQYLEEMIDFTTNQKSVADVNLDEEVDDVDARILSKYLADGEGYNIKLPYDSGEKYTITYNLNDGTFEDYAYKKYAEISLPYKLETPTKEGYAFLGWTGSNGDTPELEVTIEEGTTGNLEYTANWGLYGDANNDGRVNTVDTSCILKYLSGEENEINLITADVNLDGEADDVDRNIILQYSVGVIEKLPYDSGKKYKITYNLDGGINDWRNQRTYAEVSLSFNLEAPTKEGYVFIGWTGSNGDTPELEVEIENGTTGNMEYTAHWIAKDDIPVAPIIEEVNSIEIKDGGILNGTIDICGNDLCNVNKSVGAEVYVKTKDGYTLVEEITAADYYLFGYYLNPGENNVYVARYYIMYNDVLKVYSNYSNELLIKNDNNIITYDLNGGINAKNNPMGYAKNREYNSLLEVPTKAGYTFAGWTGSNGDTPQLKVSLTDGTEGNLHYIANWELSDESAIDNTIPLAPTLSEGDASGYNKYGILETVFDICEIGAYDYQNKPYGAELYVKTKDGYSLVESINNESLLLGTLNPGETKVYVSRVYILDENENKVYSPYSNELLIENKNIITYDLNGGANASANPMGYSSAYSHYSPLEAPTKYEYTFIGWTGSNGDTPELEVAFNGMEGHLHYIANWELNK